MRKSYPFLAVLSITILLLAWALTTIHPSYASSPATTAYIGVPANQSHVSAATSTPSPPTLAASPTPTIVQGQQTGITLIATPSIAQAKSPNGGGGGPIGEGGGEDTGSGQVEPVTTPITETTPQGAVTIEPGEAMIEYTQIGDTSYTYDPATGEIKAQATDASGGTTTRIVDPASQEYQNVKANLRDEEGQTTETRANTGTVVTGPSTVDVFRGDDAKSSPTRTAPTPRILNPRLGVDVDPDSAGNVHPGQGGTSLWESPQASGDGQVRPWWKLPAGTQLPEGLQWRNDKSGHWMIEPSRSMTLQEYQALLKQVTGWIRDVWM